MFEGNRLRIESKWKQLPKFESNPFLCGRMDALKG
jgi:hypothetical protein